MCPRSSNASYEKRIKHEGHGDGTERELGVPRYLSGMGAAHSLLRRPACSYQGNFFPSGNGPLENFNSVNTGSPFLENNANFTNPYLFPSLNTTQNRNQFRFRARLGMDADLSNGFSAGFRLASGENNSPVSTNQTFGNNGGDFSKYAVWIDRAFLKYQNVW